MAKKSEKKESEHKHSVTNGDFSEGKSRKLRPRDSLIMKNLPT
jgi:hypothetical protein